MVAERTARGSENDFLDLLVMLTYEALEAQVLPLLD
jgi:hypothetical protein